LGFVYVFLIFLLPYGTAWHYFGVCQLADGNLEQKKEVATRLVRLEKRMLHGCLQAANEFISGLPDHTVSPCPALYAPELK
jgi:hypothetical protein